MDRVGCALGLSVLLSACGGRTEAERAAELLVKERFNAPSNVRVKATERKVNLLDVVCGEVSAGDAYGINFVVYRGKATFETDDEGYGHVKYESLCHPETFHADAMDVEALMRRREVAVMSPLLKNGGLTIDFPEQ